MSLDDDEELEASGAIKPHHVPFLLAGKNMDGESRVPISSLLRIHAHMSATYMGVRLVASCVHKQVHMSM